MMGISDWLRSASKEQSVPMKENMTAAMNAAAEKTAETPRSKLTPMPAPGGAKLLVGGTYGYVGHDKGGNARQVVIYHGLVGTHRRYLVTIDGQPLVHGGKALLERDVVFPLLAPHNFPAPARHLAKSTTPQPKQLLDQPSENFANRVADAVSGLMAVVTQTAPKATGETNGTGRFTSLEELNAFWTAKGADAHVFLNRGVLNLAKIAFPPALRQKGNGSAFMRDLCALADHLGATTTLTPDGKWGTPRTVLVGFYKTFGFVDNTGRNRDYAITETMYRTPKKL